MAGPFDDLIPAQPAANPFADLIPKKAVTVDNAIRSLGSGASFGFADELAAAGDATLPFVKQGLAKIGLGDGKVSEAPDWNARYTENLARERGQDKQFSADHPYVDMGLKAVGGIGSTVAALPAVATSIGPSAIGNVAKATAVGAGLGGAAGFGEGEGTVDRLSRALVGGTLGAGLGTLQRPVAAVGRSILESPVGRAVSDSANNGALQRIATALQRAGQPPAKAEMELARLGPEATLSDVSPELLQLGVNTKTLPGSTRQLAQDFFAPREGEGRIARTGQRMVQAAEGDQPPPSHFALRGEGQAFDQNLRATGNEAYGQMEAAGLKQTPDLIEIQSNPIVSRAIDNVLNAEKQTRIGTNRAPASPVEIMHKVKQSIWDMGFDEATARPGPNASFYRDLGTAYMDRLKAANPTLAEADRAYAHAASLPTYYDAGSSIFSKGLGEKATQSSAPGIEDLLSGASPQQAAAGRAGAVNVIRDKAQTLTGARGMARDIEFGGGANAIQGKLQQLTPETAPDIIRQAKTEGIFANTANRYLGGPHTADDLIGAGDLGNIAIRATPGGGIVPRVTETAKALVNWVASPNEKVRNEIGKILLDPNVTNQKQIIERLAQILSARQAGTPVRAGLSQAAGAAGGNY